MDFDDPIYLNKVGIESSQQYSFKQLLLIAVLIAERCVTLTIICMRHQLCLIQVRAELRDEACIKETRQNPGVKCGFQNPASDYVCAMTFDESKAEPGQKKPVQVFISVFSVSLMLNSLPAQHGSDERQIVAAAAAAQSSFHLEDHRNARLEELLPLSCSVELGVQFSTLLISALFCRLL